MDILARWGEEAKARTKKYIGGFYGKRISPRDIAEGASRKAFSWIGASRGEFFPDGEEAIRFFSRQWDFGEVPLIHMDNDRYAVQPVGERALLVLCECRLRTAPETGLLLSEMQRCTFLYAVEDDQLRLVHIHASNPWQMIQAREKFANIQGRGNYEYMQELVAEKKLGGIGAISRRQREVLNLLKQGRTYQEIAEVMNITPRTVRYHVSELLIKFHAENKTQLLAMDIGAAGKKHPIAGKRKRGGVE